MLHDPAFADWVLWGGDRDAAETDPAGMARRFAAYERGVMSRTNALVSPAAGLTLPWPRALGTPPWGARNELRERTHTPYAVSQLRWAGGGGRRAAYRRLRSRVTTTRPALLYVGNAWLPRHVTLLLPPEGDDALTVYEPSAGAVRALGEEDVAQGRAGLGGWDEPWLVVEPGP